MKFIMPTFFSGDQKRIRNKQSTRGTRTKFLPTVSYIVLVSDVPGPSQTFCATRKKPSTHSASYASYHPIAFDSYACPALFNRSQRQAQRVLKAIELTCFGPLNP